RFRVPTDLERQGDFSATTDNLGAAFPFIKIPGTTSTCSATNTTGCFADQGILGKIPAANLYQPGLNILKLYPMPNHTPAPGENYNYEVVRPIESARGWQPALRMDYQWKPTLRGTFKLSGWGMRNQTFHGSVPRSEERRVGEESR